MNNKGKALSNYDPLKLIEKLMRQQKPNVTEATEPAFIYRKQARLNPKHCKKLYEIEDLIHNNKKTGQHTRVYDGPEILISK